MVLAKYLRKWLYYNGFRPYPLISLRETNECFEQYFLTISLESTKTDCASKENVTFPVFLIFRLCVLEFCILNTMQKFNVNQVLWSRDDTMDRYYNRSGYWVANHLDLMLQFILSSSVALKMRFTTSVYFCSDLHNVISIFNLGTEFLLFKILPRLVLNVAGAYD